MSQHDVEVILTQHLASYLGMPVFIVDPDGALVFYNEPAEVLLGLRFEETGPMPAEVWGSAFEPVDEDGEPLTVAELPLMVALRDKKPAHGQFYIRGADKLIRFIAVTAFPLGGQAQRDLGAVAIFWEAEA